MNLSQLFFKLNINHRVGAIFTSVVCVWKKLAELVEWTMNKDEAEAAY